VVDRSSQAIRQLLLHQSLVAGSDGVRQETSVGAKDTLLRIGIKNPSSPVVEREVFLLNEGWPFYRKVTIFARR
jgi:hypothetical protein